MKTKKRGKRTGSVLLLMAAGTFGFVALSGMESSGPARQASPQVSINQRPYPLFPQLLDERPDIPSPCQSGDGTEILTVLTQDNHYALVPVSVENGEPWFRQGKRGKGRQLDVDATDFPTLARTGRHSEIELEDAHTITDRSISEITESGRPHCSSGAGFMGATEDIISVLKGDNRLVCSMGLTHPRLARPLFHLFNLFRFYDAAGLTLEQRKNRIEVVFYNGRRIRIVSCESAKGYQDSVFGDEILGFYQFNLKVDWKQGEEARLRGAYPGLNQEEYQALVNGISTMHSGEMAAFYIMRYGFYEGHTGYRADPIALAFMFGLKDVDDLIRIFGPVLPRVLADPFLRKGGPQGGRS